MQRVRKQRCAYDGCRAWAKGDGQWCVAHPDGHSRYRGGGGAPKGNQNGRTHGIYANYVPVVDLKQALELPPADLRLEIAVTRAALADLLRSGLDARDLIVGIDKATAALVRLLRLNHQLAAAGDDKLDDFIARVSAVVREQPSSPWPDHPPPDSTEH